MPDQFPVFSGKALMAARRAAGVSRRRLAELQEVTPTSIEKWEQGRFVPATNKLGRIARDLGCTVDALFAVPADLAEGEADR